MCCKISQGREQFLVDQWSCHTYKDKIIIIIRSNLIKYQQHKTTKMLTAQNKSINHIIQQLNYIFDFKKNQLIQSNPKQQTEMATTTKPNSVPITTNRISLVYNWAHYVIAQIASERNKHETVSKMVKQFSNKSQVCVIFVKDSIEADQLYLELQKNSSQIKIKTCVYNYLVPSTMKQINTCAYKIFIFTNSCLDELKKLYFPNTVNLVINLVYPASINDFQNRLVKTREQDCNIINKGLVINLFAADGNKINTELTKKTINEFAESRSIEVTTLDLKSNPNSYAKLVQHFGQVKIIQKPESVKNGQKKEQQVKQNQPSTLKNAQNYKWATYLNVPIKVIQITKSIGEILKNTKFNRCFIYIYTKSLADQVHSHLNQNQPKYPCALINGSNISKQMNNQSKVTIVLCEFQNIKQMWTPQDVDLVIIDDQLDFMNLYEQMLHKKNCISTGTVISMAASKTFPFNMKQFVEKWSLKRLECDSLQNLIRLGLNSDSPVKQSYKTGINSRPSSVENGKNTNNGYANSTYGGYNPEITNYGANKNQMKKSMILEGNDDGANYRYRPAYMQNSGYQSPMFNTMHEPYWRGYGNSQNIIIPGEAKQVDISNKGNAKKQQPLTVTNLNKNEVKQEQKTEDLRSSYGRAQQAPIPVLEAKKPEAKTEAANKNEVKPTPDINNQKFQNQQTKLSKDKPNKPEQDTGRSQRKLQILLNQSRNNKNEIINQLHKASTEISTNINSQIQKTSTTISNSINQLGASIINQSKMQQIIQKSTQQTQKMQSNLSQKLNKQITNKIVQGNNNLNKKIDLNQKILADNDTKIINQYDQNTKIILNTIQTSLIANCQNLQKQDTKIVNNLTKLEQSVNKTISKQVQSANKNIIEVVRQQTAKVLAKEDKIEQLLANNRQNNVNIQKMQKLMVDFVQQTLKQNQNEHTSKITQLKQKYAAESTKVNQLKTQLEYSYKNNKEQSIKMQFMINQNIKLQAHSKQQTKRLLDSQKLIEKLKQEMNLKSKNQTDSIKNQLQQFYEKTFNKRLPNANKLTVSEQLKSLFAEITVIKKQYQNLKQTFDINQVKNKKLQQSLKKLKQKTDEASKKGTPLDPNMIPQNDIKTSQILANFNHISKNLNNIMELANKRYLQKINVIEENQIREQSYKMKEQAFIDQISKLKHECDQSEKKSKDREIVIHNLSDKLAKLQQENSKSIELDEQKVVEFCKKKQASEVESLGLQNKKLIDQIEHSKKQHAMKMENMQLELQKQKQKHKQCEDARAKSEKQFKHSMQEQSRNERDMINRIQCIERVLQEKQIQIETLSTANKQLTDRLKQSQQQNQQLKQQHVRNINQLKRDHQRHVDEINRQADIQLETMVTNVQERYEKQISRLRQGNAR